MNENRQAFVEKYAFFREGCAKFLSSCCSLLKLAGKPGTREAVKELISSLPANSEMISDEKWRSESLFWHCLLVSPERESSIAEYEHVMEYFDYLVDMAIGPRVMLVDGLLGFLDAMQPGSLISTGRKSCS